MILEIFSDLSDCRHWMVKLGQLLYCQEVDPRSAVGVRVPSRQGQQDAGNAALGLVGCTSAFTLLSLKKKPKICRAQVS